ncbi:MAG: IS4 family transposase [bacterium]
MYYHTSSSGSLLKILVKLADTKLSYIIKKYNSDKWAKKVSTRDQLEIMVSANLSQSKSLSDIASMIEGTRKFSCSSINKSSLSRVNKQRDFSIFEELYRNLLSQVKGRIGSSKVRIIDTSTEIVSKVLFSLWPWDRNRGAVRIGLEYDPYYELPDQIVISDGKMGDTTHGRKIAIKKGITYIMDRGFRDYQLYGKIIEKGAYFVVGMHKDNSFIVLKDFKVTEEDVISDQIVVLGRDKRRRMKYPTRVIKFWDKKGQVMSLVTNRFDLSSEEVRELYRRRWDIEVFFKFIKQNLKVKKFFGTSKNAIKTQIYCALIAYLLAYLLKPKYAKMTHFLRKLRYTLFLNHYQLCFFEPP